MSKVEESSYSWLDKLSDILMREPKDKAQLKKLIRDAQNRELINEDALDMLEGVLSVADETVRNIMIKRQDLVSIRIDDPIEKVIDVLVESKHSRIPCFDNAEKEVIGILHAKDVLPYLANKEKDLSIKKILRNAKFIPENKRLDILFKEFKLSRNHMAIILDQYGSVIGMATIEDVLEQIVGDIIDEFETE